MATGDKRLPPIKSIQMADIPGADPWAEKLLEIINRNFGYYYERFDKGISLAGNISGEVKSFEVRTGDSYEDGEFPKISFDVKFEPITDVRVCSAFDKDYPTSALAGPISCVGGWRSDGKTVDIIYVCGLEPGHRYELTFLAI